MSDNREICGLFSGRPNDATVSVLSDIAGCSGPQRLHCPARESDPGWA